jgi:hypothetical protein
MSAPAANKDNKNVIGIDLGTTNTYVTFCPYGTRNKIPLHLDGKTPAIDTAILYSDDPQADPDVFPIIGEKATVTYGQADEAEAKSRGYRYRSNFKVEITKNQESRQCAVDFLKALIRDAAINLTPLAPLENRVIVGAPSEAADDYRQTLLEVAEEAGLGRVEILDEPVGALLSDLGSRRFPLADVLDGYLVIDFGGGTCDFAYLQKGKVVRSWGDFELGGRLFDDLFFQWFCDQNPGVLESLRGMRRDFYVWSYLCRRLKEDFSETVSRDPKAVVKADVGRFGVASGLTREEFLARASDFRVSNSFLGYYRRLGVAVSDKLKEGSLDLIGWFRETLTREAESLGSVGAVSLAGGSSRWFFVKELCLGELKLAKSRILNSFNPYGAISEGLAILPGVQVEFDEIRRKVEAGKEAFVAGEILESVSQSLARGEKELAERILVDLFDARIAPALTAYKDKRVAISQIEDDVAGLIGGYDQQMRQTVQDAFGREVAALSLIARDRLKAWLSAFGLKLADQAEGDDGGDRGLVLDSLLVGDNLVHPLVLVAGGLVSVLSTTILASLFGGAGVALVAHGPAGLLAGVVGGVVISGAGLIYGQDWMKRRFKERSLPGLVRRLIASESMARKIRKDFEARLAEQLRGFGQDFEARLGEAITAMIDEEIENLGIVNIF